MGNVFTEGIADDAAAGTLFNIDVLYGKSSLDEFRVESMKGSSARQSTLLIYTRSIIISSINNIQK